MGQKYDFFVEVNFVVLIVSLDIFVVEGWWFFCLGGGLLKFFINFDWENIDYQLVFDLEILYFQYNLMLIILLFFFKVEKVLNFYFNLGELVLI